MWIKYCIPVIFIITVFVWTIYRKDYRKFQKKYRIKLPFLCHVGREKHPDDVLWGYRRYLHVRKDGHKDRRYGFNVKWWFPTKIYIGDYLCKIWSINDAHRIVAKLEPKMDLPLEKVQFLGKIEGDPIDFFGRSNRIFIRWCGKLFMFYGYKCILWTKPRHILASNSKAQYILHCELRDESNPVSPKDIHALLQADPDTKWVFITTGVFSELAVQYSIRYKVLLMDRTCLDHTFLYGRPMFL